MGIFGGGEISLLDFWLERKGAVMMRFFVCLHSVLDEDADNGSTYAHISHHIGKFGDYLCVIFSGWHPKLSMEELGRGGILKLCTGFYD